MRIRISTGILALLSSLFAGCAGIVGSPGAPDAASAAAKPWPGLIVIESDESTAYHAVTQELKRQWKGPVTVYALNPYLDFDNALLAKVQASRRDLVAAVGLPAAKHARRLWGKQVVFCQVFHYESAGLLTHWMKGVSAVPPLVTQFAIWKSLNPGLRRVAVITGDELGVLMRAARAAAAQNGIRLTHTTVSSDSGMRYAFERMDAKVQGLWLLPDNRVLSRSVLRDVLAQSQRRGLQVLVFNSQLLSLGGLMSVESDPTDVAAQTVARLRAAATNLDIPGPSVLPLTRVSARINAEVAARLGLAIPQRLQADVYDDRNAN